MFTARRWATATRKYHLPTIIVGRGGGTIKAGRFVEYSKPMNLANIHLAALRMLGVRSGRFANSDGAAEQLAG